MLRKWMGIVSLLAASTAWAGQNELTSANNYHSLEVTKLIVMPNAAGHTDWTDAISGATKSLHLTMYHITDASVISALETLAQNKSVDLRVIVDGGSLTGGYLKAFQEMQAAGVNIVGSSKAFTLTHSKAMVVDGNTAFVTAINMTNTFNNTRDFGVITPDQGVIEEVESVFETDWTNAQNGTGNTPAVSDPNLAWAPVNADAQLVGLINSARSSLVLESETFSDSDVISALNNAAKRGVQVRLIVPQCVEGNGAYNYQYLAQLKGVNVNVEVDGDSIAQPYMHSKMMLVDGQVIYIGSINDTFSSMDNDREVGVIFTNSGIASQLSTEFETDWARSQTMPSATPNCSSYTSVRAELRDLGK